MKKIRLIPVLKFLALVFLSSYYGWSSAQTTSKYQLGIIAFQQQMIDELPKNQIVPYLFADPWTQGFFGNGLMVKRRDSLYSQQITISYFQKTVRLNPNNCNDCFFGEGQLSGFGFRLGTFREFKVGDFIIYPGFHLSVRHINAHGTYGGGITGEHSYITAKGYSTEFQTSLGVSYHIASNFYLGLETGLSAGSKLKSHTGPYLIYVPVQSLALLWQIPPK